MPGPIASAPPRDPAAGPRRALIVLAAGGLLVLPGCGMIPWLVPAPEPTASAPTALSPEQLEHAAEACGAPSTAPEGDASFPATVGAEGSPPAAMRMRVAVEVDLDSSHGRHAADLPWTRGVVTDEDGTVIGLVTAVEPVELDRPRGGEQSGTLEVSLGACPAGGTRLGDPLPDGEHQLVLSGLIDPLDHQHEQQEHWTAPPLPLRVQDGRIQG